MSRFFNAVVNDDVKFNIRITHDYGPSSKTKDNNQIRDAWKKALEKSKFLPTLDKIWFQSDKVDEAKFQVVGSHPGGLYEIWISNETAGTFRNATCKAPYRFPTENEAQVANEALGLEGQQENISDPNRSTVTDGSIRSAGTTARYPQQTAVMNNISPNDVSVALSSIAIISYLLGQSLCENGGIWVRTT